MAFQLEKNDKKAKRWILVFSLIVFSAIVILGRVKLQTNLGFDIHIFAAVNAVINTVVAFLLVGGLFTARTGRYTAHRYIMLTAISLSVLFLISYICHHLLAGDTKYGGTGSLRYFYYFILGTHIPLAGIILPFILFTAYRALTGDYARHKKIARITWPIWFYVAVTGPLVYLLISPYYS